MRRYLDPWVEELHSPYKYTTTGSYNQAVYGANMLSYAAGGLGNVTSQKGCTVLTNKKIILPARFIVYGDSKHNTQETQWFAMDGVSPFDSSWGFHNIHLRHKGRANVVYMDGHAVNEHRKKLRANGFYSGILERGGEIWL